jgi:hypothetical protein
MSRTVLAIARLGIGPSVATLWYDMLQEKKKSSHGAGNARSAFTPHSHSHRTTITVTLIVKERSVEKLGIFKKVNPAVTGQVTRCCTAGSRQ